MNSLKHLTWLPQDLRTHQGEIHGKLVGLMRERLMASLKQLPSLADRWAEGPNAGVPPSLFAQNLAKQLRVLSGVCPPPPPPPPPIRTHSHTLFPPSRSRAVHPIHAHLESLSVNLLRTWPSSCMS